MFFLVIIGYLLAYPATMLASLLLLIVLHEGGHAGAALALLPGPVTVFLGSHGHPEGNYQWRVGRLHILAKRNVLRWRGGCCLYQPAGTVARWRYAILLLAGPLLPLAVAGLGFYLSLQGENGFHRLGLFVFLFVAASAALRDLFFSSTVLLASGKRTATDGLQLWRLLFPAARVRQEQRAHAALAAGRYAESSQLHQALLKQGPPTRPLYCNAIHALFQLERYAEAAALSREYQQQLATEITDDDRFGYALLLSHLGQHQQAQALYTALLDQPHPYLMAYNNRGYTYNLLGEYQLAIADFNQAIAAGASVAYAYNNRGLARLRLGEEAAGLADIDYGLALDPSNAYCHRNRGIYHLDRSEYAAALSCFEQAQQLDPATHGLAAYHQQARQHLEAASGASELA